MDINFDSNPTTDVSIQDKTAPLYQHYNNSIGASSSGNVSYGGNFNNHSLWGFSRLGLNDYSPQPFAKLPDRRTSTPRRATPSTADKTQRMRLVDLTFNDDSINISNNSSFINPFNLRASVKCSLPTWAVDSQGTVQAHVTIRDVLAKDALVDFASDKNGCRFLQEHYPAETDSIHDEIFHKMVDEKPVFLAMCRNMFGNFFVQRIVECSKAKEQEVIMLHLRDEMFSMCLDKSACRVVQLAIQKLDIPLASQLALELRTADLTTLCIDQNGNHVVQKMIKTLPVGSWDYLIDFLCVDTNLVAVCQDKYGCRVVQSIIEKLSDNPKALCYNKRVKLLHNLMGGISRNCAQLASNEFANYVVQHVIKSGGVMESYRDAIIEKCLLRNLLSMSQEKYASHVVEGAFLFAPPRLLREMMEEIFEGYVPHPETNRDALDILLFHQYGNYIIQQMIHICCSAILGQDVVKKDVAESRTYKNWLDRIKERVYRNSNRLERFSSGKKIIEALNRIENGIPYNRNDYSTLSDRDMSSFLPPTSPLALKPRNYAFDCPPDAAIDE